MSLGHTAIARLVAGLPSRRDVEGFRAMLARLLVVPERRRLAPAASLAVRRT